MCMWRPWPYAAKAIVEHNWVFPLLDIYLTFRHPMDQTVKPLNSKWKLTIDGFPTTAGFSAWLDPFTMNLNKGPIFVLPTTLTVEYDGPDSNLRTTWSKQWEPWGPIDSEYILTQRGMTAIGGYATRLTNKTGAPTVSGDVVRADPANTDSVILAAANELMATGTFVDSGIADGSLAWVAVAGIADVHMDAGGCVRNDRIVTSVTPGRGTVNNTPSVAVHFQEIAHAIESTIANANARCIIHFL